MNFYLHYENTYDLLGETTQYVLDDFLSYFTKNTKSIAHNLTDCEMGKFIFVNSKYLTPCLTYIKDNKEIFSTALTHIKSFGFESVFKRMFENIFNPILDRFHYPEEGRKYVMMYYLNGINAISSEWVKDSCQKSIEESSSLTNLSLYDKI